MITIDEFAKVEVKVGTVLTAELVPETDKLLRLTVDFGYKPAEALLETEEGTDAAEAPSLEPVGTPEREKDIRQIVSGIRAYVTDPSDLVGRQLAFATNLAPRKIKGLESNGMLFAVGIGDSFAFLIPDRPVPPGTAAH